MTDNVFRLSQEYRGLLRKHLNFYRALDQGTRAPSTEEQHHFVAVCGGKLPPTTSHEFAYTSFKKYCALSGTTEETAQANDFKFDAPKPLQGTGGLGQTGSGVPVAGVEYCVFDAAEAWFPRSEHWRHKKRRRRG
jgi:uncharacterized protein YifE (UPF0438 family)